MRRPGTGTVQWHNGAYRLRLPRSLDPKRRWLEETFEDEKLAHAFMDACVLAARQHRSEEMRAEGVTLALVWPRYVAQVSSIAARRHPRGGMKTRSRLEGMGERWLAKAPFWRTEIPLLRGTEIEQWLLSQRLTATSAKGEPVSDSWISQMAAAIRGVFHMLRMPCPPFELELEFRRVPWAMNLPDQERFFRNVLDTPLDRVMAGCQMGAGLRVWELLSLERSAVVLYGDPHVGVRTGGPDGAPTKSGRPRRVELIEPGLGFFRMAVEHHYRPNRRGLLFAGPQGGYLSSWPEKFVAWSEAFGRRLTSHSLRHAYAYSILSGFWGYLPQSITFLSGQLGHSDTRTTQRSYGHWDPGTGAAVARYLRGEHDRNLEPVTAERILGLPPRSGGPRCSPGGSPLRLVSSDRSANRVNDGDSPKVRNHSGDLSEVDYGVAHETARELVLAAADRRCTVDDVIAFARSLGDDPRALRVRVAALEGDPLAVRKGVELAIAVLGESPARPAEEELA